MAAFYPLPSSPPGMRSIPDSSPPHYKSEAIVVSSDSEDEVWQNADEDFSNNQHESHLNSNNKNNKNLTPTRLQNSPPHQPMDSQSIYVAQMNNYAILDHATSSARTPRPPITVLLALTPKPATPAAQAAVESFGARFCKDFSGVCVDEKWSCVSLYAHFREWAQRCPESEDPLCRDHCERDGGVRLSRTSYSTSAPPETMDIVATTTTTSPKDDGSANVGIGMIHPSALRAKLEQQTDVHWRFYIPVLQQLIEREVRNGVRSIVIGGLRVGDLDGVRAFARKIAEPAAILAFLPTNILSFSSSSALVPGEYESRSVVVSNNDSRASLTKSHHKTLTSASGSKTYDAVLAVLYAKCFPRISGEGVVVNFMGSSRGISSGSGSGEDGSWFGEFDVEDVVMGRS